MDAMMDSVNEGEVYFALKGDCDFDPSIITERLGVQPTRVSRKGDPKPKTTNWVVSSGKVKAELIDVYALSSKVVTALMPRADAIRKLMRELDLSAVLQVVLRVTMDDTKSMPAIGFDPETIRFLAEVGASVDVDTYRA
jgi:hypothetical protein